VFGTVPDTDNVALAPGFVLATVTDPLTVPLAVGAKRTVTLQVFFGPKLVPVQVLAVMVKAAAPDRETANAPVAEPPVFVTVNTRDADCPTSTLPKLNGVGGAKASDGGAGAAPYAEPAVAPIMSNAIAPSNATHFMGTEVHRSMATPQDSTRRTPAT
jgi:hypothetical protein